MLSLMAEEFFAQSPMLLFPALALVLFLIAFCAVTWRTLRQDRSELDRLAQLPLADDAGDRHDATRAGVTK